MQEPDLVIKPDRVKRSDQLRRQQAIAVAERRIHGITRRSSRPSRELQWAVGEDLAHAGEVEPCSVALNATQLIAVDRGPDTSETLTDGLGPAMQHLGQDSVRISRPALNDKSGVSELRSHEPASEVK